MQWSTKPINGITLSHLKQDDNANQCVAACIGMIAENARYWLKNDGALIRYGANAMRKHNPQEFADIPDLLVVNKHGIRPNAIASFLRSYGWTVEALHTNTNPGALVSRVNTMRDFDCCILVCGVDQFHAMAVMRIRAATYVLNPALGPGDGVTYIYCYPDGQVLEAIENRIDFREDQAKQQYHRSVDSCHFIASQSNLGTFWRWISGS